MHTASSSTLFFNQLAYPQIATIMTGFKLVSASLAAKTSLPPYLHYPKDALAEFGHTIRHLPTSESSYFQDPAFT
jgi:hypothetical protein